MKPGIELDILVAEKIMGLKVLKTFEEMKPICDEGGDFFGKKYVCTVLAHNEAFDYMSPNRKVAICKRYSTDIGAAWEVFEWLCFQPCPDEYVWDASPSIMTDLDYNCHSPTKIRSYWVGYTCYEWENPGASAETIPHAICLAALKRAEVKFDA